MYSPISLDDNACLVSVLNTSNSKAFHPKNWENTLIILIIPLTINLFFSYQMAAQTRWIYPIFFQEHPGRASNTWERVCLGWVGVVESLFTFYKTWIPMNLRNTLPIHTNITIHGCLIIYNTLISNTWTKTNDKQ